MSEPEYQPGDRVSFTPFWWWMKDNTPYEGTVIDAVWDEDYHFYVYHMRDIASPGEKACDGTLVLEHEIVGSKAMQAMKSA